MGVFSSGGCGSSLGRRCVRVDLTFFRSTITTIAELEADVGCQRQVEHLAREQQTVAFQHCTY